DLHDGVHAHVGHLPDGVLHEHAALHLLHQQLLDGGAVILHIPQAVEDHGDLGIRKRHALEVFPQGIPGRGHQGGVEGAADLQGQAPAGALLLGNGGGLLHSGLLTADDQLAGTVVVGDYHAPQVRGRVAGILQGAAVQIQDGHHGALPAGSRLLHGLAPESHQTDSCGGVEHTGGVKGGVLTQGEARRHSGGDALLPQHRRHTGGKGHHAGLGVAGLVDD
ncbi:putative conserved protein, partial [Dysosmobacter welbionis]